MRHAFPARSGRSRDAGSSRQAQQPAVAIIAGRAAPAGQLPAAGGADGSTAAGHAGGPGRSGRARRPPAGHARRTAGAPAGSPPPAAAAPMARTAAAVPRPPARRTGSRPVNPFLSQDPALKARRLARALISDMVVYHPTKRQDGLRDGNLKELFEEEIRKSWEEYADQVGKDVADSTPYFKEALNEILAGGRQIF